jgi:16S rRNA (uracil1498-N3)-methyltransferase
VAGDPWLLLDRVPLDEGAVVELENREARHAAGPLRLRAGDAVVLADGRGRVAEARLTAVGASRCAAELVTVREMPPPTFEVGVALGMLHAQAMDWAVQKAVEVGVGTLIPIESERSQVHRRAAQGRLGRWRRVARQAIKQCRRPWQMEVADPCQLAELITAAAGRNGAIADPDGRALAEISGPPPDLLVIGPEGGFGPGDRAQLDRTGWPGIRLGEHVLRAETAVAVGGSILVEAHRTESSKTDTQ